jgi:CheY-like chemotaxis protein
MARAGMADDGEPRPLILVADDEADIVELVAIVLRRADYRVVTASEGRRALDLARERLPVLCILDGTMPEMAGFEVLDALRADEATADIPVLILTATVDEEREIRRHGVEPDGFMKKPFDADDLLEEVARLVR